MQVVENTLVFSRAERPVVSLSPKHVTLAPIIDEIVAGFVPLASARDVRISTSVDDGLQGYVDPDAFRQMLLNLLDNAVKYGPPGQNIRVSLSGGHELRTPAGLLARKSPGRRAAIRLAVDDEGPGVTGGSRDDIWLPFARGTNGGKPVGTGCGLGLAVVRELAERHNGSAWVDDAPSGKGSRFVIELPYVTETSDSAAGSNGPRPGSRHSEEVVTA
jgi:signal transduction histidine kinase